MRDKKKKTTPAELDEAPPTYYSLHAEELKLLQFLLYHLRHKNERKTAVPGIVIETNPKPVFF